MDIRVMFTDVEFQASVKAFHVAVQKQLTDIADKIANATAPIFNAINLLETKIMASFEEVEQKLAQIQAQNEGNLATLVKIGTETQGLQATVQSLTQSVADLNGQIAALQEPPQALLDAVQKVADSTAAVTAQAGVVDALVPDAPQA